MKPTVSTEYLQVLKETHRKKNHRWGNSAGRVYYEHIMLFVDKYKAKEILDYGAGWGSFSNRLKEEGRTDIVVYEYEPAREDACARPDPCDFVICCDVLEHVEPDLLENVLEELQQVLTTRGYINVSTVKAFATLADGRNAHLIVETPRYWYNKISEYFKIKKHKVNNESIEMYVERLS